MSPIIAGKAVEGPDGQDHGASSASQPDSRSIARHYDGLIDGFVHRRRRTRRWPTDLPMPAIVTNTMMRTLDDKVALARQCLAFCDRLARSVPRKARRPRDERAPRHARSFR